MRWSKFLKDALQKNPDGVLAIAKELSTQKGKLLPTQVFERLISKEADPVKVEMEIEVEGRKGAVFRTDPKGRVTLEFESGVLSVSRQKELFGIVKDFLSR